ncbi:LppA family lipoprotein [Saccharopolyspora gloriosae]|uniref:LppA family lipoprotein n=1 Tax=Saccharopolyspora gloriosae TaxID=455344 RepID=UPI001FB582AD|nr:LppA family lipoprotein [Saccharopolyspora gloriosae]
MDEQETELVRRPSIEEVHLRYSDMDARLKQQLSANFPWMHWERVQDVNRAACADFDAFKNVAESWTLGIWGTEGNMPDADWARAQQIFADVTGEFGFTPPRTIVDRSGNHRVTTADQYGATYNFGSGKRTSFSGETGCHLPQTEQDKQAPPPQ